MSDIPGFIPVELLAEPRSEQVRWLIDEQDCDPEGVAEFFDIKTESVHQLCSRARKA